MYIVRSKKTKEVLHVSRQPLSDTVTGKELYAEFNGRTMELLRSKLNYMPRHYKVDDKGFVQELSVAERVEQGIIELQPTQKLVKNQIVSKSLQERVEDGTAAVNEPFDYIGKDGQIARRSAKELVDNKLIQTKDHARRVAEMLNHAASTRIQQAYPAAKELRLIKDFLLWLHDGSPKDDPREAAFLQMESFMETVRTENRELKEEAWKQAGGTASKKKTTKATSKPAAKKKAAKSASTADSRPSGEPEATLPEGKPDEFWTVANIRLWMQANGLEFVNRDDKGELLDKIKASTKK